MQADDAVVPKAEKINSCARCHKAARYEVWGQPSCLACAHAWDAAAPLDEAWDAKYPEDQARYAAKREHAAKFYAAGVP